MEQEEVIEITLRSKKKLWYNTPYVPLTTTQVVLDPDSAPLRKAVYKKYSKKMIEDDTNYGHLKVDSHGIKYSNTNQARYDRSH
jgi:hypothetical protein